MYLGQDDILEQCDALDDTLSAARAALESMAAQSLSFSAQLRVQHESTRRAKRWVRAHLDGQLQAGVDETDEILRHTLGSPLDDGPEGSADPLVDIIDDTDTGIDELIEFDDALEEVTVDPDSFVSEGDDSSTGGPLIVFDDDEDAATTITLDPTGTGEGTDFLDDLSENLGDEPSSPGADDSLVSFDESEELVTIGPNPDDDGPIDLGLDNTDQGGAATVYNEDPPTGTSDATLVADLESLVRLKDMISEDAAAAHGPNAADEEDTAHVVDPARVSATTLTDDDLGKLGFGSAEDLVSPSGADADPNSESAPRPEVRLPTPEPAPRAKKKGGRKGKKGKKKDDAAIGVSIPTIREQQAKGAPARPSAAAVRINPEGGAATIEEPEPLALGEADDPESVSESGFALQVEEYELVEEEEAIEALLEDEPAPVPVEAPTLSSGEEQALLVKAKEAHERGELPVAADLYSDLLDFNPDNAQAALGRGRVYLDLGDYARAMSDFTIAEDILPDDPDVNAAVGELYYARKDYSRAIEYFDRALDTDPKHAMAWCRRGIAHYYRKDYDKAYKDLVQAQKLDDAIPNIRTYIGMVKKKRK